MVSAGYRSGKSKLSVLHFLEAIFRAVSGDRKQPAPSNREALKPSVFLRVEVPVKRPSPAWERRHILDQKVSVNTGPTLERFEYPEILATLRGSSEGEGFEDDFFHPFGRGDGRSRERYEGFPRVVPKEGFKHPFPLRSGQDFRDSFIGHIPERCVPQVFHFKAIYFWAQVPQQGLRGRTTQRPLTADVEAPAQTH